MRKHIKVLMSGLLLACLCFALPATVEAASAKSEAAVQEKVLEKKQSEQPADESAAKLQRSDEAVQYLKGAAPQNFTGRWMQDRYGWWFQLTTPFQGYSYLRDAHVIIEGSYYYFNNSGYMVTGWYQSNGYWYYFNASGAQQFGWEKVGSKWYYLDPSDGHMWADTWLSENDNTCYYFTKSGAMAENTWLQTPDGTWYFYKPGGLEARGWAQVGSKWYYFDLEDGAMYSDYWLEEDKNNDGIWETCYYLGTDGAMYANQWLYNWLWEYDYEQEEEVKVYYWFYYGADGKEYRGWNRVGASWYYFDPYRGAMYDGWFWADENNDGQEDTWYYLGTDGAMRTGWIHTTDDLWYYHGSDGRGYTHWHKIGGVWYHFDDVSGEMYEDGYYYLPCENKYAQFADGGAWMGYVPSSWFE